MHRRGSILTLLCLTALAAPPARADDGHASAAADGAERSTDPPTPRRYDYSRYSNGPRRVPRPRGASQRRAEALGLGTERVGHRLLIAPPEARWVRAAGGEEAPDQLMWPVENGRFGRGFGFVRRTRPDLRHDGVDVVAEEGSVVRAAADGIVAYSDNGIRGYGNCVILVHPGGWVTLYAHTYRTTVQPGWRVHAGERIAFVGSTGISHGPHVHFELHIRGRAVDPLHRFEGRPWIQAYRRFAERRRQGRVYAPTDHLTVGLRHQAPPRAGERADAATTTQGAAADAAPSTPAADPPNDGATPTSGDPAANATTDSDDFGVDARQLRHLLRRGATDAQLAAVEGRLFRSVLWPARGGERVRSRVGLRVASDESAPARAIADGRVLYVGRRRGVPGTSIALLHPNGWISVYGGLDDAALSAGDAVLRGAWLGHFGSERLRFELWSSGHRVDVEPLLVGAPAL